MSCRGLGAPILLCSLLVAGCGADAIDPAALDDGDFLEHLDRLIPEEMRDYAIPGVSVLVIRDRETAASRTYGFADGSRARPLTITTTMMTHSISKSVTAWGVMKLVADGVVGLDDPLHRHLRPETVAAIGQPEDGVTIRRLLSHSAGLPLGRLGVHYPPDGDIPPLIETLAAGELRAVHAPGAVFEYSNSGYVLLELLVEEVTGRDYGEYMSTEILRPLGMEDSGFYRDAGRLADVPTGYDLRGRPVPVYLYPYRASGGLFSTLEDLGRFVLAGMPRADEPPSPAPLSAEEIERLHTPQVPLSGLYRVVSSAYGLGHFVETLPGGHTAVWHGGQGAGWMTHFHAVPATGDGIVILTNSQRSWPLIARILDDWAHWHGHGSPGMTRIVTIEMALKFVVIAIALVTAARAWVIGRGVAAGRRKLGIASRNTVKTGMAEALAGLVLLSVLLCASRQDYLFISSVFPTGVVWLGVALFALAIMLLASALLPLARNDPRGRTTASR